MVTLFRLVTGLLVLGLCACGGQPYSYHSANEIPRGAGLLTGEAGVYGTPTKPAGGD